MTLLIFLLLATFGVPFAIGCKQIVLWLVDLTHRVAQRRRDSIRRRSQLGLPGDRVVRPR